MVIIKNKVTNGMAWCPVSHGVSPKGVFQFAQISKIIYESRYGHELHNF